MPSKCKCGKHIPSFNFTGLKPEYCGKCKLPGMIDVKNKLCKCGKSQSSFNFTGLKPEYCGKCKLPGMVNVVNKKCKCGKHIPNFNFTGLKRRYCRECKLPGMINVTNKQLKAKKITKPIKFRHKSNKITIDEILESTELLTNMLKVNIPRILYGTESGIL